MKNITDRDAYLPLNCETLEERQMLSTVDIFAAGTTNQEVIELQIDGQVVQTWSDVQGDANGGQTVRLSYSTAQEIDPGQIRVAFVNDFSDPATGVDRNVRIDKIVVDGQTIETESAGVFSTGTWKAADGVTPGFRQDEFLHANGYFQYPSNNAGSTIEARVRGDQGTERFNLLIGGNVVGTYDATTEFQTFTYNHQRTISANNVRIEFINDQYDPTNGIDSNLEVDSVRVDGRTFETEDASVFSTGTWRAADGIVNGFGRGEVLNGNGYFQFRDLPNLPNNGSIVEVVAKGSEGGEQFNLIIDSQVVETFTVTTENSGYVYQAAGDVKISDIRVEFINDEFDAATGFDRNLEVDFVRLDGTEFHTYFQAVYSEGSIGLDGEIGSGFGRAQTLFNNGFFQYGALDRNVRYRVTFDGTWSPATHPGGFPSNAHFSGLIGATHDLHVDFWEPGVQATAGIEDVAETGRKGVFSSEIDSAIAIGFADKEISGGGIATAPGSVSLEFDANSRYSLLTLVSMIAPSPDWFVGVHDLSLIDNDGWIDDRVIELNPYDAGTDNGVSFNSPDSDSDGVITRITDGPLANAPLGTFRFERIG